MIPHRRRKPTIAVRLVIALICGVTASAGIANAQDAPQPNPDGASNPSIAAPAAPAAAARNGGGTGVAGAITKERIIQLLVKANPMLWPLALCSIVALGFSLERWAALRRGRVIPKDFVNRFMERLTAGRLDRDRALELCRAHDSPAARIFAMAARYWGQPATVIRQGVSLDAGGELIDLKRNVRVLNGTATLAPLLGLLGTVIGLIEAFGALGGKVGTAKGEALAHGISLALVATAVGLAIAVVSVTLYYWFLHKIDALVKELDDKTRSIIDLICGETQGARSMTDRKLFAADLSRPETASHSSSTASVSAPIPTQAQSQT